MEAPNSTDRGLLVGACNLAWLSQLAVTDLVAGVALLGRRLSFVGETRALTSPPPPSLVFRGLF